MARRQCMNRILIVFVLFAILLLILLVVLLPGGDSYHGVIESPPPSDSLLGIYKDYAISADSAICAEIGGMFLSNSGASVVDAAVASILCTGLANPHSAGIGGGFFMLYYNKTEKKIYMFDAREMAPKKATENMFEGKPDASRYGGLAIAVPGEIRGLHHVHSKFGNLPWAEVLAPIIKLCQNGIKVSKSLKDAMDKKLDLILNEPSLREIFYKEDEKEVYGIGEIIRRPVLAETLKRIAEEPDALYTGSLTNDFLSDLKEFGSIISKEDLSDYKVIERPTVDYTLLDRFTLHSAYPPGSGAILGTILKLYEKTNQTSDGLNYHYFTEAMKFGYAKRSVMADPDFVDMEGLITDLTSEDYLNEMRLKIRDDKTFQDPGYYGGEFATREDRGTSHLSLIDKNGNAVAITSTINGYFGAMRRSRKTGIILNNEMDDFSSPGLTNQFNLPPSKNNFIAPGKRPFSSMAPTIILEGDDVRMVTGAAGGTRITSGTAFVIAQNMYLGKSIKRSTDEARIHHQLLPMEVSYEYGVLEKNLNSLHVTGHKMRIVTAGDDRSVVCSLTVESGFIFANSDYRKGGNVTGA